MFHFLEQLRKKPIAYRKRFLLITTCTITGIIFLFWISTFSVVPSTGDSDKPALDKQFQPIEEIKSSVGNFIDEVKAMTAGIFGDSSTNIPVQATQ